MLYSEFKNIYMKLEKNESCETCLSKVHDIIIFHCTRRKKLVKLTENLVDLRNFSVDFTKIQILIWVFFKFI